MATSYGMKEKDEEGLRCMEHWITSDVIDSRSVKMQFYTL